MGSYIVLVFLILEILTLEVQTTTLCLGYYALKNISYAMKR